MKVFYQRKISQSAIVYYPSPPPLPCSGGGALLKGPPLPPRDHPPPNSPPTQFEDGRYIRSFGGKPPEPVDYISGERPPLATPGSPPTPSHAHTRPTPTQSQVTPHHRVLTSNAYETRKPPIKAKPDGVKGHYQVPYTDDRPSAEP